MKNFKISFSLVLILVFSIVLTSCTSVNVSHVAKVNDENVSTGLFNFYLTQVKAQLQPEANAEYWETAEIDGQPAIEVAKEKALEEAAKLIIISQKAKELGVELTEEDVANIETQKNNAMTQIGGQAAYEEELKKMGIDDKTYGEILEIFVLRNKMLEVATNVDDKAARDYYNTSIARVKHVLILTTDATTGQPLTEEQVAAAKTKAEDVLARAKSGEDFDALVASYSEDPGSQSSPEGYYLGKGFALGSSGGMVTEFEEASLALAVDEVSEIVETAYGYHIIKRYENDEEKYTGNTDEITYYARSAAFEDVLAEWYNSANIEINEKDYSAVK